MQRPVRHGAWALGLACLVAPATHASAQGGSFERALLDRYCVTCHNDRLDTGGLSLETVDVADPAAHAEVWEKVVRKLRAGSMPPQPRTQPATPSRA